MTKLTRSEILAMRTSAEHLVKTTRGLDALGAWCDELQRNQCEHELDRTWPIVRSVLERAEKAR